MFRAPTNLCKAEIRWEKLLFGVIPAQIPPLSTNTKCYQPPHWKIPHRKLENADANVQHMNGISCLTVENTISNFNFKPILVMFSNFGWQTLTRAPLGGGGAESASSWFFQNNSKTVADIDTKFGVPYLT